MHLNENDDSWTVIQPYAKKAVCYYAMHTGIEMEYKVTHHFVRIAHFMCSSRWIFDALTNINNELNYTHTNTGGTISKQFYNKMKCEKIDCEIWKIFAMQLHKCTDVNVNILFSLSLFSLFVSHTP